MSDITRQNNVLAHTMQDGTASRPRLLVFCVARKQWAPAFCVKERNIFMYGRNNLRAFGCAIASDGKALAEETLYCAKP